MYPDCDKEDITEDELYGHITAKVPDDEGRQALRIAARNSNAQHALNHQNIALYLDIGDVLKEVDDAPKTQKNRDLQKAYPGSL